MQEYLSVEKIKEILIKDFGYSAENIQYCNGIMGVPITFLDKYNPDVFEVIGTDEAEGTGFSCGLFIHGSRYKQCYANNKRIYKRIFILRK